MANESAQRDAYSPDEVAERLGVTGSTVRRWVATGELDGVKVGGLIMISAQSYEALLARMRGRRGATVTMEAPPVMTMAAPRGRRG